MQQQEDKKVQENEYLTVYTADDILYIYPTKKEISFESGHTMTFQTQDQMKLFIENETARQINN